MSDETGVGAFRQATGRDLEDGSGQYQRRYRAYQFDVISRHCGPTVLEVGAGLGEFASQFHGLRRHVVTDVDPDCVASMARRFADRRETEARQLDLQGVLPDLGAPVSTVIAINVLEHIEDDSAALRALAGLVEPGGKIVLWVPGYMQLYGDFDRRVGHVRRYTPTTLRAAIVGAGLWSPATFARSTCSGASPGGSPCAAEGSAARGPCCCAPTIASWCPSRRSWRAGDPTVRSVGARRRHGPALVLTSNRRVRKGSGRRQQEQRRQLVAPDELGGGVRDQQEHRPRRGEQ